MSVKSMDEKIEKNFHCPMCHEGFESQELLNEHFDSNINCGDYAAYRLRIIGADPDINDERN